MSFLIGDGLSNTSCAACRRLKRRCSRNLPACVLCTKVKRSCEYAPGHMTPMGNGARGRGRPFASPGSARASGSGTSAGAAAGYGGNSDLSSISPFAFPGTHCSTPRTVSSGVGTGAGLESDLTAHFLDSVSARGRTVHLPTDVRRWEEMCPGSVALSHAEAQAMAEEYWRSTHAWLPIVSRTRLIRQLTRPDLGLADPQVLLYAMRINCAPSSDERDQWYRHTSRAVMELETSAFFSTNVLAAHVLLALYELGQGIFPAAYMTIGSLAKVMCMLGLHDRKNATQILPRPDKWIETEERRRIWWAAVLLDRYVHVGLRFRPLFISKLAADTILPADDELTVNPLLVMSIEASTTVAPFARQCQAAHLLGLVCEHVNSNASSVDADMHFEEAFQISRALKALIEMLHAESEQAAPQRVRLYAARALAYAAQNVLWDVHACIEPDNVETIGGNRGLRLDLQQHALGGYKETINNVLSLALELERHVSLHGLDQVPATALFCLYSAAGTFAWSYREQERQEDLNALVKIRQVLGVIGRKYEVASEFDSVGSEAIDLADDTKAAYLKLLEGQENVFQGAY